MIDIKSPTRVDLAGGTLDMWPLYNFVGEAKTINLAIDIWTRAQLKNTTNEEVILESLDYKKTWSFKNIEEALNSKDSQVSLYQCILRIFYKLYPAQIKKGFHLITESQSPIGGGLGGSSSLTISVIKAFAQHCGHRFLDAHQLVQLAHNIEAALLKTPTGTQDYYPAITSGLSCLSYSVQGIEQQVMDPTGTPLETHFLLCYTGKSHHSGLNNFEVLKSCVEGDVNVLEALHQIKTIADDLWQALQAQKWDLIPELFKKEFKARLRLTPAFSSPEIEKLAQISLSNGASAVKICGAGGGGCVLIWVQPEHRQKVVEACEKEKFQCLPAKPVYLKNE